jgi:hypothetical protein
MKPILSLHVLMLVCPAPGFSHQQQPGVAEEEEGGKEGREGKWQVPTLLSYPAACDSDTL